MPSSDKTRKAAKGLLGLSLDQEGRVDEQKVRSILDSLREEPPPHHRSILEHYHAEVQRRILSYEGELQIAEGSADEAPQLLEQKIKDADGPGSALHTTANPKLIAGIRLRIGDDVYEDSIDQRLENLRKSIS